MAPIGVGIIGASPDRGWSSDAHIPALRSLPAFTLAAVSTSRRESADAAARAYEVPLAFDNHAELVARPEVDLVTVAVKVPYHHALVSSALDAGKAVYCEWPLGNGSAEAEDLAARAERAGVYAAVGLQARSSPVIRYLRRLLADHFIGRVLSTSVVASGMNWGADIIAPYVYLLDSRNGATMLSIPFGHSIDALCWSLGEFEQLNATMAIRRPEVALAGSDRPVVSDVADQIAIAGTLAGGVPASIHFRGGMARGTNFLWEINGTDGDLQIIGDGGHIQMVPIGLRGARADQHELVAMAPPKEYDEAPGIANGIPANVTRAYARLARDWQTGTRTLPGFADAAMRHRMLDAITRAAETSERQSYR